MYSAARARLIIHPKMMFQHFLSFSDYSLHKKKKRKVFFAKIIIDKGISIPFPPTCLVSHSWEKTYSLPVLVSLQ